MLSYQLFDDWFHGDASVIGRSVRLGARQATVVAVLPRRFSFQFPAMGGPDVQARAVAAYAPLVLPPRSSDVAQLLNVVMRLSPRATIAGARRRARRDPPGTRRASRLWRRYAIARVAVAGPAGWRVANRLAGAAWRCRIRAADCVREPGEPVAGAGLGSAERNGDSCRDWRRDISSAPAIVRRVSRRGPLRMGCGTRGRQTAHRNARATWSQRRPAAHRDND